MDPISNENLKNHKRKVKKMQSSRNTLQPLLPLKSAEIANGDNTYTSFPYHTLNEGAIYEGYGNLVDWILNKQTVCIDGYSGVFWSEIRETLKTELEKRGLSVNFIETHDFLKSESEIKRLTEEFMGEKDSVWGKKATINLSDFYNIADLKQVKINNGSEVNIVMGTGAALFNTDGSLIYLDVPKNEIQYRMRASAISNLGFNSADTAFDMYKRFFFVDWVVLNKHKREIFNRIDLIVDTQWANELTWMTAIDWKNGLRQLSNSFIRARPWFEKGAWGGQWMKEKLGLNPAEINYAWSFELITPENGILFEHNGNLLETAFDSLMIANEVDLLGKHAGTMGEDFPIRFNFLDTFKGGNLSIQCHPTVNYIQENFGETLTQDETYYILDNEENALVYLGFQEEINPAEFKEALISSQKLNTQIEITDYVQALVAKKHDLFLIPNGTIHSAGVNNLVLEISATPYLFTFKMYDWVRLDLNGKPRPINIEHAFNNLNFERKGKKVTKELISKQQSIDKGKGWEVIHLPTHEDHFYDIHRLEFEHDITVNTGNTCHVLMLVEGDAVEVVSENRSRKVYQYAETFIIPAAAKSYTLTNKGKEKAKVVKAFLK